MKQSFLPKPLLFKEWKEYRWWLTAGLVLLLYSTFSNVFALLSPMQPVDQSDSLVWHVLVPVVYHLQYSTESGGLPPSGSFTIQGQPCVSPFSALVSMGLLIALITLERNRGSLWYTLSFPVRRIDVLRVKVSLALGTVLCGFLLDFILLFSCNLAAHSVFPLAVLLQWTGQNILISLTLMAIGLVCATIIPMGLAAGLVTFLLCAFPSALGMSVLRSVPSPDPITINPSAQLLRSLAQGPTTTSGHISAFLSRLSPTSYFSGGVSYNVTSSSSPLLIYIHSGPSMNIGVILWFILLMIIAAYLGVYAYSRISMELSSKWIQFPQLEPWFRWFCCGTVSFFAVNAITVDSGDLSPRPYIMMVYWLGMWVILGLILNVVITVYRSRGSLAK